MKQSLTACAFAGIGRGGILCILPFDLVFALDESFSEMTFSAPSALDFCGSHRCCTSRFRP